VSRVDDLARALAATGFAYDVHDKPEETLRFFSPFLSEGAGHSPRRVGRPQSSVTSHAGASIFSGR
jgi:hypothetical protein